MGRTIKDHAVGGLIFKPQADGSVIVEHRGKTVMTYDTDGSVDMEINSDLTGNQTVSGTLDVTGAATVGSLDAGSGDITTTGNISGQIVGAGLSYAAISITGGSTTQTTNASAGTFDTVTGWASDGVNGPNSDATADKANNKIITTRAGTYLVMATFSWTGTNTTTYTIRGYNSTATAVITGVSLKRKIGTGADVGSASMFGFATTSANDDLIVQVASDGNSSDFTIEEGSFNIHRLGD